MTVIREFGHPLKFPAKVVEEAKKISASLSPESWGERQDLRNEVVVTIDGETARDFDDAVSISPLPEGGWRLKVSIADVSYYVHPGSAVDREAYTRATSVYFPDRCLPMLPEELSNHLCSLVPGQDRLTMTAELDFDRAGNRYQSRFYRSVIRSHARLTYTLVNELLVKKVGRNPYEEILPALEQMEILFRLLRSQRLARGSLDFDLPEPSVVIDLETGEIERIVKAERYASHRMIEEFMIAANEAVAEFLQEQEVPALYRIHEPPAADKTSDFLALLHNMGFQITRSKSITPKLFASIIEQIRGKPQERLLNTLLLRTMKQAYYDPKNKGHFGLASRCYTHFTSPIRRYPDLVVHRALGALVSPSANRWGGAGHERTAKKRMAEMATHCSDRERNAMKTEWAVRDLAAVYFMKGKIGKTYEGIISNVTKFGFFVELADYFVEGLVGLRNLTDDYYIFDEKRHRLLGRRTKQKFQIGDSVRVRVRGVNEVRRWLDFLLETSL